MILIRTNCDIPTYYMYKACEPILEKAKARGCEPIILEGVKLCIKEVSGRIKKLKPKFIFFNGHGSKDAFYDNNNKELITLDNADLLSGTVTYARACDSLVNLGVKAVECGCLAFVGYNRKFWIARTHEMHSRPLKDQTAQPVIESSNIVAEELLNGKTVDEAVNKSHELAAKLIIELLVFV